MEIINLDMVPGKKSPVCHASQYDDGRVIRFNLYDSGLPYTLDGTETITFEVRKPDGNIVTSTLTNTSDSYVDVVTTEQMTAVKGANLCEVRVEKGATNIGSLNVIMAVEMDPTDGGIASASAIDNLRSQVSGMVAEEVAEQYDAGSVIFDSVPTPGHGNGYAVTSEGVNNALAPKADRSELPDMTNYYDKTETDDLLDQKADTSDLPDMSNYYTKSETDTALAGKNASNLPVSSSDPTNTKDYIDNGLSGKADTSDIPTRADFIRYADVTVGAVEFTTPYISISSFKPTTPAGYTFLCAVVRDYGSITGGTSAVMNVDAVGGNYLFGITGSKYSNVLVRYIYIKT